MNRTTRPLPVFRRRTLQRRRRMHLVREVLRCLRAAEFAVPTL